MRRPAVAVAAGLNEKDKGNAKEKRRSAFWVWVEKPRGPPKAKTREKETRRDTTAPTPTAPRRVVRDTVINITRPTVPRASTTPARVSTQPPPRTTSRTLTPTATPTENTVGAESSGAGEDTDAAKDSDAVEGDEEMTFDFV